MIIYAKNMFAYNIRLINSRYVKFTSELSPRKKSFQTQIMDHFGQLSTPTSILYLKKNIFAPPYATGEFHLRPNRPQRPWFSFQNLWKSPESYYRKMQVFKYKLRLENRNI